MMNNEQIKEKSVVYVGNDPDFIDELKAKFLQKGSNATIYQRTYYSGSLISIANEILPSVIIIEITNHTEHLINEEIAFLKKHPSFTPIMLIAIMPDKESLENYQTLATCGINFFYIKGCEYEHLFRDCLIYGLETFIICPTFARASNLRIKYKLNALSSISALNASDLFIDTDIYIPDSQQIKLELNFLKDEHLREFEVIEHYSYSTLYPTTDSYYLKFPFPGPWDEVTDDALRPETISDFVDNYMGFDSRNEYIWLFSKVPWIEKLFLYSINCPFHIEKKSFILTNNYDDIEWKKPSSIFIELREDSDEEHEAVMNFLQKVQSVSNYFPIVFILKTQFSSNDLKKRNNFDRIVASTKSLEFDFFTKAIETLAVNPRQPTLDFIFFKKDDSNRCLNFEIEVFIKSLTEHEIQFEINLKIPLFSLLQIKFADKLYITIVDSDKLSDTKFLYTGILHGMNDFGYQTLRKIVNQLIYNPKNDLSQEEIKKIINFPHPKTEQEEVNTKSIISAETSDIKSTNGQIISTRSNKYLKSKL